MNKIEKLIEKKSVLEERLYKEERREIEKVLDMRCDMSKLVSLHENQMLSKNALELSVNKLTN